MLSTPPDDTTVDYSIAFGLEELREITETEYLELQVEFFDIAA
jgi:hypothetical protein